MAIRNAGIGIAATAFLLSLVNDTAILTLHSAQFLANGQPAPNPLHVGATLPTLVCILAGAISAYDRSRLSRIFFVGSAGSALLIVALNLFCEKGANFISPQVGIASIILASMMIYYGVETEGEGARANEPVQMNPIFTP